MLTSDGILDLSRQRLEAIPHWTYVSPPPWSWEDVRVLDLSRNLLKGLPPDFFQRLPKLESLNLLGNELHIADMPLDALRLAISPSGKLRSIDLRYNQKLEKEKASALINDLAAKSNSGACVRLARLEGDDLPRISPRDGEEAPPKKESACDRDGTRLECQLAPWSTPQLRRRLAKVFGESTDPETVGRAEVMQRLLTCYAADRPPGDVKSCTGGHRVERRVLGTPLAPSLVEELTLALQETEWPRGTRERPKIDAEQYFTFNKPDTRFTKSDGAKAKLNAAKLEKHEKLWTLAEKALRSIDPEYCDKYFTALAVTYNFRDSPHIDTENLGPFYALGLGDYACGVKGGARGKRVNDDGYLAVEYSPKEVCVVDTFERFGKVDGRYPHWVVPYTGTRYSLIYFQCVGDVVAPGPAVFAPFEE